ncbi:MAG: zinc ABC transporter substrate-binding protein [Gammaproteobacteria bacterium]|nr:zinc ABC transporter substrate-binding protein [Gammaproteobacteria bacterium]
MRILLLISFSLAASFPVFAQPQVVTSLRPLQLIAQAITEGISEPLALLDGTQDPHHPALKPSQRLALSRADIFLWIGPQLETGFEAVANDIEAVTISALSVPGIITLEIGDQIDPHIWLDTENAIIIAAALASELGSQDEANAKNYQANLNRLINSLGDLQNEILADLDPNSFPAFAVYHNAYQYFENQFGIAHADSFTNNEEIQPGIRHILTVKKTLAQNAVQCIVVNPAINTDNLNNQLQLDDIHFVSIDVLGHEPELESASYNDFIRHLAQSFADCRL